MSSANTKRRNNFVQSHNRAVAIGKPFILDYGDNRFLILDQGITEVNIFRYFQRGFEQFRDV